MNPKSYPEFAKSIIDALESLPVDYAIGGSFASNVYGETRTTIDIDISIVLSQVGIQRIVEAIQRLGYHISHDDILDAVIHKQPFNVIDPSTGFKVDFFIVEPTPLEESILSRRRRMPYGLTPSNLAWVYSPEDTIVYKLKYYLIGQSQKHLRDIVSILIVQGTRLDRDYIEAWAVEIGATEVWNRALIDYGSRTSPPST
jgi:hypothetical protein